MGYDVLSRKNEILIDLSVCLFCGLWNFSSFQILVRDKESSRTNGFVFFFFFPFLK